MSTRKKRMIVVVIGVVLCCVILAIWSWIAQKKDAEEFEKRCRQYVGEWQDEEGKFEVKVRRVSSAHMVISINNITTGKSLSYISAVTSTGDVFEFSYDAKKIIGGEIYVTAGTRYKGILTLQENKIAVQIPKAADYNNCLEYQGVLSQKKELESGSNIHIRDYMGTTDSIPKELKSCASIECDKNTRKVERIHVVWERKDDYYAYDMAGITKVSFEGDCAAIFGEADAIEELSNHRKKLMFHDDTYQYYFILSQYGMVAEADCQYIKPNSGIREDDFIVQGDTIIRYLGDYEKKRTIQIPKHIKKIATGAFTLGDYAYNLAYVDSISLKIPKDVVVEPEAFKHCGKMGLSFEEGTTVIAARSFANMVSDSFDLIKRGWVKVDLPDSLIRIEEEAFAMGKGDLQGYWNKMEDTILPLTIIMGNQVEYIGDNALWGCMMAEIPSHIKYIGTGFTYRGNSTTFTLPKGLEEIGDNALYLSLSSVSELIIPVSLKKMGDNPFCGASIDTIIVKKKNKDFQVVKKNSALLSKDGKQLYYLSKMEVTYTSESIHAQRSKKIKVPDGVEVIRKNAIPDMFSWDTESDISVIVPASVRKMSRKAGINVRYVFQGKAPVFTDEFDESTKYKANWKRTKFEIRPSERKKLYQNICPKDANKKLKAQLKESINLYES